MLYINYIFNYFGANIGIILENLFLFIFSFSKENPNFAKKIHELSII